MRELPRLMVLYHGVNYAPLFPPGTLTLNKLSVEPNSVCCLEAGVELPEVLKMGALSANIVTEEPIDMVLWQSCPNAAEMRKEYKTTRFVPFNPTDKYTSATLVHEATGETFRVMKGSPQVRNDTSVCLIDFRCCP
jgi:H+-transporting ATPase